jgi:hypothetical protein
LTDGDDKPHPHFSSPTLHTPSFRSTPLFLRTTLPSSSTERTPDEPRRREPHPTTNDDLPKPTVLTNPLFSLRLLTLRQPQTARSWLRRFFLQVRPFLSLTLLSHTHARGGFPPHTTFYYSDASLWTRKTTHKKRQQKKKTPLSFAHSRRPFPFPITVRGTKHRHTQLSLALFALFSLSLRGGL